MVGTIHRPRHRRHGAGEREALCAANCVYRIDEDDCIVAVGGDWRRFARANHGAGLGPARVVGTPLWDHIAGLENRLVYVQVLESVRENGHPVTFVFRCDAPDCRRDLEMTVSPRPRGECEFQTTVVRHVPRHPLRILDPRSPRNRDTIMLCNWCMRTQLDDDLWQDIESATEALCPHGARAVPQAAFTICPDCLLRIRAALHAPVPRRVP